jgi:hypothetical protein
MSDDKGPTEANGFLCAAYRTSREVTSGKHVGPGLTGLSRVAMVGIVLAFGGSILWAAIRSMPTALVVFIGSFVVFRLARWCYRRGYFHR